VDDGHELFINGACDIKDSVDGSPILRPDLVCPTTGKDQSFRRRDVDIVIEVKNDWPDPVKQAATYAPGLFCSNCTRSFALVMGVNQGSKSARFVGGGVNSSLELPIIPKVQVDSGFHRFVQMMKTILNGGGPRSLVSLGEETPFSGPLMFPQLALAYEDVLLKLRLGRRK
jgi:hypothetical protein